MRSAWRITAWSSTRRTRIWRPPTSGEILPNPDAECAVGLNRAVLIGHYPLTRLPVERSRGRLCGVYSSAARVAALGPRDRIVRLTDFRRGVFPGTPGTVRRWRRVGDKGSHAAQGSVGGATAEGPSRSSSSHRFRPPWVRPCPESRTNLPYRVAGRFR